MKVLNLTIKKKWFDMIASGKKTEEYREIKPYWGTRLTYGSVNFPVIYDHIKFVNGYSKKSPTITMRHITTTIGIGRPEWGAPKGKSVFIIHIKSIA